MAEGGCGRLCLQKQLSEWKPEMRMPSGSDYVVLTSLDWNTEYEVLVVAENLQGKSQPGVLTVRTDPEPAAIPGTSLLRPPIRGHAAFFEKSPCLFWTNCLSRVGDAEVMKLTLHTEV